MDVVLLVLEELVHGLAHLGRVVDDLDAVALEASNLRGSITLSTSNDGTGVTHSTARRSSLASDETNNGQVAVVMLRQPLGSLLFSFTADLTNHDNTFSLRIIDELGEHIDEVGTVERITANADNGRLTEVILRGLVDGLVREGTGARDDTNLSLLMNVTRHDTNLAFAGLDNTGAVRTDESSLALRAHDSLDLDHVEGRDTLSDADDEVHLGFDGLKNGVGSKRRRNINDGGLSISHFLALGEGSEDGETEMLGAALSLVDATNNLGAVGNRLLSMEGTVLTSHTLDEDLGVLVDEHVRLSLLRVDTSLKSVHEGRGVLGRAENFGEHF